VNLNNRDKKISVSSKRNHENPVVEPENPNSGYAVIKVNKVCSIAPYGQGEK